MAERKQRAEGEARCVRARGLKAAIAALEAHGPKATLESVAELARCPKASLARVFGSKESLFEEAFEALGRSALTALRDQCLLGGGGRSGVWASCEAAASRAREPSFRGCPLAAAGASLGLCQWAFSVVERHRCAVIAFYALELEPELGRERALMGAQTLALSMDGLHLACAGGFGPRSADAALRALRASLDAA
jgi:AcrR family transcriptional regulator